MEVSFPNAEQTNRKRHNSNIIERMLKGRSLQSFDSMSSWFPPRPVIKKDNKAVSKLYTKLPGNRLSTLAHSELKTCKNSIKFPRNRLA